MLIDLSLKGIDPWDTQGMTRFREETGRKVNEAAKPLNTAIKTR